MKTITMPQDLRTHISEIYDSASWEAITGKLWLGSDGYQLLKLERDVEYNGETWRCLIIERLWYDADVSREDVDRAEDILAEAWPI